ncbi:MAG: DUF6088 family protein [Firmicutes bacterium]|nr:DUF6088 family protein [Bacillota bacterium]
MGRLKYLADQFGYNAPFSASDINDASLSYENVRKMLSRLAKSNQIARYDHGVYYIPSKTIFGPSTLNIYKVIDKKYIQTEKNVFGFVTSLAFENQIGLTTQVPATWEIVTNNEKSKRREVKVRYQKIILKKPAMEINRDNYLMLQILEYIRERDIVRFQEEKLLVLKNYIVSLKLYKNDLIKCLQYFPAKVSKRILEGGLDVLFIQNI